MRHFAALALVALLVLAGCAAPTATGPGTTVERKPPDPVSDVRGWEDGYWYNESISVDPSDGIDAVERDAIVARSMARVERVREVEFEAPVNVRLVSRSEYRDQVTGGGDGGSGNGDPSPARLYQEVQYEALFLVGNSGGGDATREQNQNDASTVQGYYSIRQDEIVIIYEGETPDVDEITLSQELFHAYQFRHLIPDRVPVSNDAVTAWLAVIEGDANLVDAMYKERCRTEWNCVGKQFRTNGSGGGNGSDGGNSSDVHMGLYLLQYFPYSEGEQYVREIRNRRGWDGVNALYDEFPNSTEQVIHRTDERPGAVGAPDSAPEGWTRVDRSRRPNYVTVGEAGLATMFAYSLYDDREGSLVNRSAFLNLEDDGSVNGSDPLDYGLPATTGWDGDRLYVYRDGSGNTAYVWRIRWDDSAAAREFLDAYRELLAYRGAERVGDGHYRIASGPFADAFYVERRGDTVTIVNAPNRSALADLYPPGGE